MIFRIFTRRSRAKVAYRHPLGGYTGSAPREVRVPSGKGASVTRDQASLPISIRIAYRDDIELALATDDTVPVLPEDLEELLNGYERGIFQTRKP